MSENASVRFWPIADILSTWCELGGHA